MASIPHGQFTLEFHGVCEYGRDLFSNHDLRMMTMELPRPEIQVSQGAFHDHGQIDESIEELHMRRLTRWLGGCLVIIHDVDVVHGERTTNFQAIVHTNRRWPTKPEAERAIEAETTPPDPLPHLPLDAPDIETSRV